ncbi:aldehyde dehydrogenase family protein [Botrimarina sp.]|uniref:aldehyde dehydrogenase family protein n=1 Tax=Botrimarina sp. TaxID=2795802 RepID=UPI0032EB0C2C
MSAEAVAAARAAQGDWEHTPISERLRPIAAVRRALGADPRAWADEIQTPYDRTPAESLAAECLPTADASRWLQRHAARLLRTRRSGGWLQGVSLRVVRKPHGVVLVIGAGNYPLFLLAVPALQALAAGNAALLKPPPGCEALARRLHASLVAGGLDPALAPVLGETAEAAQDAIDAGVDHVVATGSSATGRAVARSAADKLTPCTLECSGSDAVVVLPGADPERVARCVAWGLTLNAGATCIGPRRLIAVAIGEHGDRVIDRLPKAACFDVPEAVAESVRRTVGTEIDAGARIAWPEGFDRAALDAACDARRLPPIVLTPALEPTAVGQADLFAPVLTLDIARDADHAVTLANASRYALGASVFGPAREAERVARRLRAGSVTVNDLIAPTADPDAPFGGAGESGYGVTRGAEGLLAMTRPQAIARRRGRLLLHADPPTPALDDIVVGLIQSQHAGGWSARGAGLVGFLRAAKRHRALNHTKNKPR